MGVSNEIFCCEMFSQKLSQDSINFVGFAYQGKDMVFRFIIEYIVG